MQATAELGANLQSQQFATALRGMGAAVTQFNTNNGIHDWPWWRKYLAASVARGIWGAPPVPTTAAATNWSYDTMQLHGNAWGVGYQFPRRPSKPFLLRRTGQLLKGSGGSGPIRISAGAADADASGNGRADCTYELQVPFTQVLPAGC